jgi:acyl-coenzyme A synthetase/AMP-(fatty) acid ligase
MNPLQLTPYPDLVDWECINLSAVAVISEGRPVTYGEFRQDVEGVRAVLAARLGAQPCRLGILFGHEYWNWVVHLAAWQQAAQILSLREADTAHVQQLLRLDLIVCGPEYANRFAAQRPLILEFLRPAAGSIAAPEPTTAPENDISRLASGGEATAEAPRRLVLTSGTTGASRCVGWSADATLARIAQLKESLQMSSTTRLCAFQHIGTTGGFRYPIACWQSGGVVLLRGADAGLDATWASVCLSNLLVTAPTNLRMLTQKWPGQWPCRDDRHVILAGGRVPPALFNDAITRVARTISLAYGSTETGAVATGNAELIHRHPGAAGFVREGVQVEVVDEADRPLPFATVGRVRIKTPYMVTGYDPLPRSLAQTGHAFRNGWFYPSDRGVLHDDGFLAIEGREGDIVNVGGAKVSLAALEQKLEGLPGVNDLCVLLLQLPDGDRLGVVVVAENRTNEQALHQAIKSALRPRTPYILVYSETINRNAMGKVPRPRFAQAIAQAIIARTPSAKPSVQHDAESP